MSSGETLLIAGPPAANPPLLVAGSLVAISLVAPFFFLREGSPSVLLGLAALALAAAGIITVYGAIAAQLRLREDAAIRPRALISVVGVTFQPRPDDRFNLYFSAADITSVHLLQKALVLQTNSTHPQPGRYVLRFGNLETPRGMIIAALTALNTEVN